MLKSLINKNLNTKTFLDIVFGEFWFYDYNNNNKLKENNFFQKLKSNSKSVDKDLSVNLQTIEHKNIQSKKEVEIENKKDQNIIIKNINQDLSFQTNNQQHQSVEDKIINSEYVPLVFENITIDSLYIKHKILLKYIKIEDNLYIKSIIFKKINKEFGCYNKGENLQIVFKKDSDSLLQIIAKEKNGKQSSLFVVNGVLVK